MKVKALLFILNLGCNSLGIKTKKKRTCSMAMFALDS